MKPVPIKSLLDAATPGPWHVDRRAACRVDSETGGIANTGGRSDNKADQDALTAELEANAQLIARLSPATVRAVVEALIDSHLYIDDGLEGNPAKRKAMLLQIERALALLNGEELP